MAILVSGESKGRRAMWHFLRKKIETPTAGTG